MPISVRLINLNLSAQPAQSPLTSQKLRPSPAQAQPSPWAHGPARPVANTDLKPLDFQISCEVQLQSFSYAASSTHLKF